MHSGHVSLIGAGCGQADLITLRGLTLLQNCDAVVYDDLIDPELLEAAPPHAQRIYMGKRSGAHSAPQQDISNTLIRLAQEGKQVARLKGGDPFVFGRGGEEILALRAAGIPFDVVPGISSAIAIPAAAGIPVTHRGASRSFHVITGHTASEEDPLPSELVQLAHLDGTLVILMGLKQLPRIVRTLLSCGKSPNTPAAVLSGGNVPTPTTIRGTLSNIASLAEDAHTPAVIVIGETAALDLSPSPRPLEGVRIAVTGTAEVAQKQLTAFRSLGATAFRLCRSRVHPLPCTIPLSALEENPGWIVFTSANGVNAFFQQLHSQQADLRSLARCRFAVIGPATAQALAERGFRADLQPEKSTTRALAQTLLDAASPNQPVYLFRSAQADPHLSVALTQRGFRVLDAALYDVLPEKDPRLPCLPDYITFSSAGGVQTFFQQFFTLPPQAKAVCIGEVTAREMREYTDIQPILAREISAAGLIQAVLEDACAD